MTRIYTENEFPCSPAGEPWSAAARRRFDKRRQDKALSSQRTPRRFARVNHQLETTRAAFTLIELLVVIAIMAILASIVTISLVNKPGEAKVIAAGVEVKILQSAVKMYHVEQGHIPTMEQGLLALVERPVLAPVPERYPQDGYLDGLTVPDDPWDNPYIYLVPGRSGESFEIISYGSDGEPEGSGDAADISSSNPKRS